MITFADIFCGCGGLSYGFYNQKDFEGLLAVDWWPIAGKVFSKNLPKMPFELHDLYNPKEVYEVSKKLKDKCDILLGGPPCQGFSTLGKRRDSDKRSSLVEVFLELCVKINPKIVIMENVRGIMSKKHWTGKTFPNFLKDALHIGNGENGYNVQTIQIKTIEYGLAQTRIRWFLIATRKDVDLQGNKLENIIQNIEKQKIKKMKTLREVISDLPKINSGEGSDLIIQNVKNKKREVYNHRAMNHSKKVLERLSYVPVGGGLCDIPRNLLTDHLKKMVDGKYGSGGHIKNIYGRLDWKKPCGTIVAGIDKITCGRFVHPDSNRLLTPRECARIQSFPDDFRFFASLVNQYYLIGNAVPPKISGILANSLKNII